MSELTEFYIKVAPQCRRLAKKGSYWYLTWTCKLTGRPCGPCDCPDRPDLKDLIKPSAPEEPFQQAAELVVGASGRLLESDISGTKPGTVAAMDILPTIDVTEKASNLNITRKNKSRAYTKPHVAAGSVVKRALITFVSRTGEVRRWGFDCIFSPHTKKPTIREFQWKTTTDARFYFPREAGDEEIRSVAAAWFEGLKVHDPEARISSVGTPQSYDIAILEN
jgi:hypothetical protein